MAEVTINKSAGEHYLSYLVTKAGRYLVEVKLVQSVNQNPRHINGSPFELLVVGKILFKLHYFMYIR